MQTTEEIELLEKLPRRVRRSAKTLYHLYQRRHEVRSLPYITGMALVGLGALLDIKLGINGWLLLVGIALAVPVCCWLRNVTRPIEADLSRQMAEEFERGNERGLNEFLVDLVIEHPQLYEFVAALNQWM